MSTKYIHAIVRTIKQRRLYMCFEIIFFFLFFFLACSHSLTCQTINLYAGFPGSAGSSGDGGQAISARFDYPGGTVSDKEGNLFIADVNNHVVRKVSPSGIISTVAGDGTFGYSGDGGPATSAKLWDPTNVAIDSIGNLYILEYANSVVRKVDKQGIISTIAGIGTRGYSGDGGPAILARLNGPCDLHIDKAGNIYIADKFNAVVRKINTSGIISTVAGNAGTLVMYTGTGDGRPATEVHLLPYAIATDNAGNLYIAEGADAVIRKVDNSGIISTFAGNRTFGYSGDGGSATLAQFAFNSPSDIAFDDAGNLYAADYGNQVIRKVNTSGIISTIAGIPNQYGTSGDGGPALSAKLWFPKYLSVDSCNNFFITDPTNQTIRKVSSDEAATVNAGPINISVCGNSKASFGIRAVKTTNFQWMINTGSGWMNVEDNETYSGTNTDTLQISKAINSMDKYQYLCVVSNDCGPVYSTTATLSVKPSVLPSIAITASDTSICTGSNLIFTAEVLNAGTNAVYQWKKDGVPVGTNTPSYSDNSLKNGAIITCILTSVNGCLATDAVLSNSIVVRVDTALVPSITITASSDTICLNAPVTFRASTVNAGIHPVFQWKINGKNAGTNSDHFTTSVLNNGDILTCVLSADSSLKCVQNSYITSNSIPVNVKKPIYTPVTIFPSANNICGSEPITFTASAQNGGTTTSYLWLLNGHKAGTDNIAYTHTAPVNNDQVNLVVTTAINGCSTLMTDTSNTIVVSIKPIPHIQLSSLDTTVMAGTQVQLTASVKGDIASFSWTPENAFISSQTLSPLTIPVEFATKYKLAVVATNGCIANKESIIKVSVKLYMPNSFSPNRDGKNDLFRIPPGTTSINLMELSIYNRWGTKIFTTSDITKGWDGNYKGGLAETGSYIYIIKATDYQNRNIHLKGSVLLIR